MLHMWDAVEADFLRDYGIVLVERIDKLSWRYFLALLNNLSIRGAVAMRIQAESQKADEDGADDESAASAFFSSIVSM